jgi:predicted Zn-dependent protease
LNAGDLAAQLDGEQTPETLYRVIRATTRLGEQYFEKLQKAFPDSASSHQLRGDVYRLRQDFPSALVEFQAAVQKRPDDAALHQSIGEMCIQLRRLDDAKAELQEAAKLNHSSAETNYLLGQVLTKQNQMDAAIAYLRRALQLDPNLLQARALLGTAYMHLDKPAQAVPELEKALPLDYYGDLHFQLYRAYKALGQADLAANALAVSKQLREKSLNAAVAKIGDAETLASPASF